MNVVLETPRPLFAMALLSIAMLTCAREQPRPSAPPPSLPPPAAPSTQAPLVHYTGKFAGCYRAEWKSAHPFAGGSLGNMRLPRTFELTITPVQPGAKQLLIKERNGDHDFDFAAEWEQVSDHEIQLTWSTGFVGFTISASPSPEQDVLNGVASTFSDAPTRPDTAKVKLVRISCL